MTNSTAFTAAQLAGQVDSHLSLERIDNCQIHQHALPAYQALQTAAAQAGFKLRAVSGFRSFQQQLNIWNNKFNGLRAILDSDSQPLNTAILSDEEKVFAILRWSMLPGASRHHWGTEIDVCDSLSLPSDYQLQLIPQEYDTGGYLADFTRWLDANIAEFGFFKPYQQDLGGVAREPWHISFKDIADNAQQQHDLAQVTATIEASDIAGKAAILANIETIHQRYVINISI